MHLMDARENEVSPVDKLMLDQCFGIITGDFCGKCLHHRWLTTDLFQVS